MEIRRQIVRSLFGSSRLSITRLMPVYLQMEPPGSDLTPVRQTENYQNRQKLCYQTDL